VRRGLRRNYCRQCHHRRPDLPWTPAARVWLWFNVAHNEECYGSMAVYLRLQKLVPPSSQARGGGGGKGKAKQ